MSLIKQLKDEYEEKDKKKEIEKENKSKEQRIKLVNEFANAVRNNVSDFSIKFQKILYLNEFAYAISQKMIPSDIAIQTLTGNEGIIKYKQYFIMKYLGNYYLVEEKIPNKSTVLFKIEKKTKEELGEIIEKYKNCEWYQNGGM